MPWLDFIIQYIKCCLHSYNFHLITLGTRETNISLINVFSFYIRIYIPGVFLKFTNFCQILFLKFITFLSVRIQYLFSYVLPNVFDSNNNNSNAVNSKSLNEIVFFHARVRIMKINFKTKQNIPIWFPGQCSGTQKDWIRKEFKEKWWSKVFILYLFISVSYDGVPGM